MHEKSEFSQAVVLSVRYIIIIRLKKLHGYEAMRSYY